MNWTSISPKMWWRCFNCCYGPKIVYFWHKNFFFFLAKMTKLKECEHLNMMVERQLVRTPTLMFYPMSNSWASRVRQKVPHIWVVTNFNVIPATTLFLSSNWFLTFTHKIYVAITICVHHEYTRHPSHAPSRTT